MVLPSRFRLPVIQHFPVAIFYTRQTLERKTKLTRNKMIKGEALSEWNSGITPSRRTLQGFTEVYPLFRPQERSYRKPHPSPERYRVSPGMPQEEIVGVRLRPSRSSPPYL